MQTNDVYQDMIIAITKAVNVVFVEMMSRLSTGEYPSQIRDSSKTIPATRKDDKIEGAIEIDLNKAPMALAFELGSGLWAEVGPRSKYPILPDKASILAFNWPAAGEAKYFNDRGEETVIPGPNGKVFLPGVMHPGIRAKPYFEPSLESKLDEINEIIINDFTVSLSKSLGPDVIVIK